MGQKGQLPGAPNKQKTTQHYLMVFFIPF
jgi:hypothetical protein